MDDANKGVCSVLSEGIVLSDVTEWIPTGFKTLDFLFGGGWPVGRASEVSGKEGCGKSALSHMAIYNCQLLGGTPLIIDFERSLDSDKMENIGINPDDLIYCDPDHCEEAWDIVFEYLDELDTNLTPGPGLIVWDSVAGTVAQSEREESSQGKSHYAAVAGVMDKGCRKMYRRIAKSRAHMLWVNQQRPGLGLFAKAGTPGGKQLKFAASLRVSMYRKNIKRGSDDDTEVVGYECYCITDKCRLVPPHRKAFFVLDFMHGPSEDMTMFRALLAAKKIKSAGGGNYAGSWSKRKFKKVDWLKVLGNEGFREGAEKVYDVVAEEMSRFRGSTGGSES